MHPRDTASSPESTLRSARCHARRSRDRSRLRWRHVAQTTQRKVLLRVDEQAPDEIAVTALTNDDSARCTEALFKRQEFPLPGDRPTRIAF